MLQLDHVGWQKGRELAVAAMGEVDIEVLKHLIALEALEIHKEAFLQRDVDVDDGSGGNVCVRGACDGSGDANDPRLDLCLMMRDSLWIGVAGP